MKEDCSASVANTRGRMSRLGIGPTLASLSIVYCLVAFLLTRHFDSFLTIYFISAAVRRTIGTMLIGAGIVFFVVAVFSMVSAYNADRLNTQGVFRACRHPIYAAWIVFIVPGMALLANSLIGLTAPFVMYILLKLLIHKEEGYLAGRFGAEYAEYKKNTPDVLPIGWIRKTRA